MSHENRVLLAIGAAAGALALFVPERAEATARCLPPSDCTTVEVCCKPPPKKFEMAIARAEARRDFYASEKTRKIYDSINKAVTRYDDAFTAQFGSATAPMEAALLRRYGLPATGVDDVPELITKPPGSKNECTTSCNGVALPAAPYDALKDPTHPINKGATCREQVVAAIDHEVKHQERCNKNRTVMVIVNQVAEHGEDEAEAYAQEAAVLRWYKEQATRRCSEAKKKEKRDFDNAMKAVDAAIAAAGDPGQL